MEGSHASHVCVRTEWISSMVALVAAYIICNSAPLRKCSLWRHQACKSGVKKACPSEYAIGVELFQKRLSFGHQTSAATLQLAVGVAYMNSDASKLYSCSYAAISHEREFVAVHSDVGMCTT